MLKRRFLILLLAAMVMALLYIPPAAAAPRESGIIHVVQQGETLYSIARRYGVSVQEIARANRITNPDCIYVGQRLVIPSSQSACGVHVVQAGETMLQIAMRYGVDAWAIARANGITNLNLIYVGQRLTIPCAGPPPQPQPQPKPQPPPSFPGPWNGEYFDNLTLTAPPYITRTDPAINFDWGSGPPAGGMPINAFSVRWTGSFDFEAGTYQFNIRVDDGARVYVDDELIIDGWRDGGLRLYTAQRALNAGSHTVKVEYYDRTQVARVHFWWKKVSAVPPVASPTPSLTATPVPPSDVWFGTFYNNEALQGEPVATHYAPALSFDWGAKSPFPDVVWWDGFSARWVRKAYLNTDHYRFCAMSDDGVRLWVGQTLVLDEWHANDGSQPMCKAHWVSSGTYDIKVEYYEHGGNALIHVWWEPH